MRYIYWSWRQQWSQGFVDEIEHEFVEESFDKGEKVQENGERRDLRVLEIVSVKVRVIGIVAKVSVWCDKVCKMEVVSNGLIKWSIS